MNWYRYSYIPGKICGRRFVLDSRTRSRFQEKDDGEAKKRAEKLDAPFRGTGGVVIAPILERGRVVRGEFIVDCVVCVPSDFSYSATARE